MASDASKAGKTVWVTGSTGFMGSTLSKGLARIGYDVVGTGAELSVSEPERLEAFAEEAQPDFIVNCAGIRREATTVNNKVKAYEVNALGAKNVAIAANTVGATIIQISSDDVYGRILDEPVNEFDPPHPDTPYGKSKLAGETMVRNTTPDHLILRSSWVYQSDYGRFKEIMDAAANGEKYEARTDQFASPASIGLYLKYLVRMMEKGAKGTYNITPTGKASRYDFAYKLLELAGYDPTETLVQTQDPSTAEDIVLESLMLEMAGAKLPTWEEGLESYMEYKGLLGSAKG